VVTFFLSEYSRTSAIYKKILGEESAGIIKRLLDVTASYPESDFRGLCDVYLQIFTSASSSAITFVEAEIYESFTYSYEKLEKETRNFNSLGVPSHKIITGKDLTHWFRTVIAQN
jgi:hypothetical protein